MNKESVSDCPYGTPKKNCIKLRWLHETACPAIDQEINVLQRQRKIRHLYSFFKYSIYPQKLAPDIHVSVTRNFLYFESCLPQIYSVKTSVELLSCLGTNNQRFQSSFEDKMATQKERKTLVSEAFLAVFRPY